MSTVGFNEFGRGGVPAERNYVTPAASTDAGSAAGPAARPAPAAGPATMGDARHVAELLLGRGVRVDPDRLLDRVQAERSRAEVDGRAAVEQVRALASAVRRLHREWQLDVADLRRRSTAATRAAAAGSQRAYADALDELRETCLHDEQVVTAALGKVR